MENNRRNPYIYTGITILMLLFIVLSGFLLNHQKAVNVLLGISLILAIAISGLFETSVAVLLLISNVFLLLFKNIELIPKID